MGSFDWPTEIKNAVREMPGVLGIMLTRIQVRLNRGRSRVLIVSASLNAELSYGIVNLLLPAAISTKVDNLFRGGCWLKTVKLYTVTHQVPFPLRVFFKKRPGAVKRGRNKIPACSSQYAANAR